MDHQPEDHEGQAGEAPKRPKNKVKSNRRYLHNINFSGKRALLILNQNYSTTEWAVLPGVVKDGDNMKEMLEKQGFGVQKSLFSGCS